MSHTRALIEQAKIAEEDDELSPELRERFRKLREEKEAELEGDDE